MLSIHGLLENSLRYHVCSIARRCLSQSSGQKVTKQLMFFTSGNSNENRAVAERPVVVVYAWLLARSKALNKVVDYYTGKGCDVLTVRTSPTEFMWPSRAQRIIDDMLHFSAESQVSNR